MGRAAANIVAERSISGTGVSGDQNNATPQVPAARVYMVAARPFPPAAQTLPTVFA